MIGLLRAEFLRMRQSRALLIGLLAVVGLVGFSHWRISGVTTEFAQAWERRVEMLVRHPEYENETRPLQDQGVARIRVAKRAYTPAGAAALSAGLMSSALGTGLAVGLGVWVLGTEFTHDTMRYVFLRQPRRIRMLLSKFGAGAITIAVAAASVALITGGINAMTQRSLPSSAGAPVPWTILGLGSVGAWLLPLAIVPFLGLAIAFLCSLLARSALGGLIGSLAFIVGDAVLAKVVNAYEPWSISFNVWSLGSRFRGSFANVTAPFVWLGGFARAETSTSRSALYLMVIGVAALSGAILRIRSLEL